MIDLVKNKILVTGAHGFLGRFVVEELIKKGALEENIFTPSHKELDLTKLEDCRKAVDGKDIVIHLAAKLGGIKFYIDKPADILRENVMINAQMMEAARLAGVKKFVAIGSSGSYPKDAQMPLKEDNLWDGYPDESIAPYAVAKRMLFVQAKAYRQEYGLDTICLIPANIYGPRFDDSHMGVIPSLIRKAVEAKKNESDKLEVWGSGKASREFFYVGDAARGIVMATEKYDKGDPVNLGSGEEVLIKDAVEAIKNVVGFQGEIVWDASKPDGALRRVMDVSRAREEFDFEAEIKFKDGISATVDWYMDNS